MYIHDAHALFGDMISAEASRGTSTRIVLLKLKFGFILSELI